MKWHEDGSVSAETPLKLEAAIPLQEETEKKKKKIETRSLKFEKKFKLNPQMSGFSK